MPLKKMGTVDTNQSASSLFCFMQGIELEWSYRSNVPAARGVSWVFFCFPWTRAPIWHAVQ